MVLSNCRIDGVSLYPTYRKPFHLIFRNVAGFEPSAFTLEENLGASADQMELDPSSTQSPITSNRNLTSKSKIVKLHSHL
jgi:hypothetical protein